MGTEPCLWERGDQASLGCTEEGSVTVRASDKGLFRPRTGAQGAAALCLAQAQTLRSNLGQACPASSQAQGPTGHLPRATLKPGDEGCSGEASWPTSHQAGGSDRLLLCRL